MESLFDRSRDLERSRARPSTIGVLDLKLRGTENLNFAVPINRVRGQHTESDDSGPNASKASEMLRVE